MSNIHLFLDDDESNKIRVAAYSNQALCYQKTNDHFEGRNAVSIAKKCINNFLDFVYCYQSV